MQHHWPIIALGSVDSTNNYANQLLAGGALHETVITAQFQRAGKGQAGASWTADEGMNLTFSLLLFPAYLKAEQQFALLQSISLAVTDFLLLHNIAAQIKWPNDIYVQGHKIAGILIENSLMANTIYHSVVGIGLNVNQTSFPSLPVEATSMARLLQKQFDTNLLLQQLLNCLWQRIVKLKELQFGKIQNEYIESLYLFNTPAMFKAYGKTFEGKITNVLPTGELEITDIRGNKKLFLFKEVEFKTSAE